MRFAFDWLDAHIDISTADGSSSYRVGPDSFMIHAVYGSVGCPASFVPIAPPSKLDYSTLDTDYLQFVVNYQQDSAYQAARCYIECAQLTVLQCVCRPTTLASIHTSLIQLAMGKGSRNPSHLTRLTKSWMFLLHYSRQYTWENPAEANEGLKDDVYGVSARANLVGSNCNTSRYRRAAH